LVRHAKVYGDWACGARSVRLARGRQAPLEFSSRPTISLGYALWARAARVSCGRMSGPGGDRRRGPG